MGAVGDAMRERRAALGLSQPEAAVKSGLSLHTWCDIETGRREPKPRWCVLIARALGVAAEELAALAVADARRRLEATRG